MAGKIQRRGFIAAVRYYQNGVSRTITPLPDFDFAADSAGKLPVGGLVGLAAAGPAGALVRVPARLLVYLPLLVGSGSSLATAGAALSMLILRFRYLRSHHAP